MQSNIRWERNVPRAYTTEVEDPLRFWKGLVLSIGISLLLWVCVLFVILSAYFIYLKS